MHGAWSVMNVSDCKHEKNIQSTITITINSAYAFVWVGGYNSTQNINLLCVRMYVCCCRCYSLIPHHTPTHTHTQTQANTNKTKQVTTVTHGVFTRYVSTLSCMLPTWRACWNIREKRMKFFSRKMNFSCGWLKFVQNHESFVKKL